MLKKVLLIIFILGTLALLNTGCSLVGGKRNAWKPATPQNTHFEHVVKWPGETLRIIAKWYTNDTENWSSLADANPQLDYNNLIKGNIIYIPGNLLKNKKALPESYILSYNQKSKPTSKKPPKPLKTTKKPDSETKPKPKNEEKKKKDDFELFGPK
jgi:hypothetical protein